MTNPFTDEGRNALEAAFSSEIAELEGASAGPVDLSILAILGDSVSADVPGELWSAESMDKVENAIRSGDATVTAEATHPLPREVPGKAGREDPEHDKDFAGGFLDPAPLPPVMIGGSL